MISNTKSFSITVKNSQTYQLIAAGFGKTQTWFLTIAQYFRLVAAMVMQSRATSTVSLRYVRLIISTLKLTSKLTGIVAVKATLSSLAKLQYKIESIMVWSAVLTLNMKIRAKVLATFGTLHTLNLTMILAVLNFLSDYDAQTLGTLDPQTIGDLDYTLA